MSLVKVRLAAMMFLEYFIWGAWYVTVGTWLGRTRHFTGSEIALVGGTTAVAAIVSPFVVGWLADRFFATQHVIAVLHLAGAVLLWVAASQTTFGAIYWLILAYACLYMPTLALTNSLAFRQMKDPKLEFGPIRVLGTAGWIVAGLIISHLNWEVTAFPLKLAAVCSAVFAVYALTLPHTPPLETKRRVQGHQRHSARSHPVAQGQVVLHLCAGLVPDLHSAAVLLRIHQSLSDGNRRLQHGRQNGHGPGF
jgi:nucleoside transporter